MCIDEERFFEEDDDDDEPSQSHFPDRGTNGAMNFIPRTMSLVDYDDDDDDDLTKGGSCPSPLIGNRKKLLSARLLDKQHGKQ